MSAPNAADPPGVESRRVALRLLDAVLRKGLPLDARLDSITFSELATPEMNIPPNAAAEVLSFITQGMMNSGPQMSAYGARSLPNLQRFADDSPEAKAADRFISFPGGNALSARYTPLGLPNGWQFNFTIPLRQRRRLRRAKSKGWWEWRCATAVLRWPIRLPITTMILTS